MKIITRSHKVSEFDNNTRKVSSRRLNSNPQTQTLGVFVLAFSSGLSEHSRDLTHNGLK